MTDETAVKLTQWEQVSLMQNILVETIEYYKTHRRSVGICDNGLGCQYWIKDGRMCAVGRCMVNPQAWADSGAAAHVLNSGGLDAILRKEYRGLGRMFWRALQLLHDSPANWTRNDQGGQDPSRHGYLRVFEIATFINNGAYTNESA